MILTLYIIAYITIGAFIGGYVKAKRYPNGYDWTDYPPVAMPYPLFIAYILWPLYPLGVISNIGSSLARKQEHECKEKEKRLANVRVELAEAERELEQALEEVETIQQKRL